MNGRLRYRPIIQTLKWLKCVKSPLSNRMFLDGILVTIPIGWFTKELYPSNFRNPQLLFVNVFEVKRSCFLSLKMLCSKGQLSLAISVICFDENCPRPIKFYQDCIFVLVWNTLNQFSSSIIVGTCSLSSCHDHMKYS